MQMIPLGDCAVLVVLKAKSSMLAVEAVTRLAHSLNKKPLSGVTDIVPSFTTITVHYDPSRIPTDNGKGTPWERVTMWIKTTPPTSKSVGPRAAKREVVVPVCYGGEHGPDLGTVATHTKQSEAEIVRLHSNASYRVAAVGFSPGFPYLLGLPSKLTTPRRATPRTRVPVGSVGIGGAQTGIYSTATPGGWSLIGRTPLRLFKPEDGVAPTILEAGDILKFVSIKEDQFIQLEEKTPARLEAKTHRNAAVLEVVKPGALTTVQDLGRTGRQHQGIPVGGPMDREAARVANLILGNDENAPLLEATLTGPELRFLRETWIAVTGASVRGVAGWRPLKVGAGEGVSFAELGEGTYAYIAVAGGLDIPHVLGGAGTLLRAEMGGWNGRPLRAGDRLGARPGFVHATGSWSVSSAFKANHSSTVIVRFISGPQWNWFSASSRRSFIEDAFKITPHSDRMGLRLEGPSLRSGDMQELTSEGVGFGSIQVPSDGNPIILMADRQTIGGYPKIGHVISVDLPRLAQARPGTSVRFQETTVAEAQALYLKQEQTLAMLRTGLRAKLSS
jgi:KipI family sensor histidine kinase inhibitor